VNSLVLHLLVNQAQSPVRRRRRRCPAGNLLIKDVLTSAVFAIRGREKDLNARTNVFGPIHAAVMFAKIQMIFYLAKSLKISFWMALATHAHIQIKQASARRPAVFATLTAKTAQTLFLDLTLVCMRLATQTQMLIPIGRTSANGPVIFVVKIATSCTPQPLAAVIHLLTPAVLFLV